MLAVSIIALGSRRADAVSLKGLGAAVPRKSSFQVKEVNVLATNRPGGMARKKTPAEKPYKGVRKEK